MKVERTGLRVLLAVVVGFPLLLAVVLMASRVGDRARFVTWTVVAFTGLAAVVAMLGLWTGFHQPLLLAFGVLPAMFISYFLPAFPFLFVAVALVAAAVLALTVRGMACGIAAATGTLMVVFVVLQVPAVECGEFSVSANSGPWWIAGANASTASGFGTADGDSAGGTAQVGAHRYRYACDSGRLITFERLTRSEG